jgi:hypothetical protein
MTTQAFNITAEGREVLGGVLFDQLQVNTTAPEFLRVLYARHATGLVLGRWTELPADRRRDSLHEPVGA